MKTSPTPRAWEADLFWREVVQILTGGKKLRSEHYLDKLDAAELEQLRLALSSSGSYVEQQKFCPPRRGGPTDGEPPSVATLCEIAQAMRQTWVLQNLERERAMRAATKERAEKFGFEPKLVDAVLRIVGEEVMAQHARGEVGSFALKASGALMKREQQAFDQERFKEGLRTKLESAFHELALAVKGNAVAEEHIRKARELIAPQK